MSSRPTRAAVKPKDYAVLNLKGRVQSDVEEGQLVDSPPSVQHVGQDSDNAGLLDTDLLDYVDDITEASEAVTRADSNMEEQDLGSDEVWEMKERQMLESRE